MPTPSNVYAATVRQLEHSKNWTRNEQETLLRNHPYPWAVIMVWLVNGKRCTVRRTSFLDTQQIHGPRLQQAGVPRRLATTGDLRLEAPSSHGSARAAKAVTTGAADVSLNTCICCSAQCFCRHADALRKRRQVLRQSSTNIPQILGQRTWWRTRCTRRAATRLATVSHTLTG